MNMILNGVFSANLIRKNTLADDVRKFSEKDRFDVILTNPPFGGTEHDSVTANFPYPSKATSITFLQHIMKKVRRGGRVGMVIDEGVLFKNNENAYVQTKKEFLEQFKLWAIVSLPAGVFANAVSSGTGPKTNLLFFNRDLSAQGKSGITRYKPSALPLPKPSDPSRKTICPTVWKRREPVPSLIAPGSCRSRKLFRGTMIYQRSIPMPRKP